MIAILTGPAGVESDMAFNRVAKEMQANRLIGRSVQLMSHKCGPSPADRGSKSRGTGQERFPGMAALNLAPSTSLRKWFGHYPARWNQFRRRYRKELKRSMEELQKLAYLSGKQTVTLVYSAADEKHNQAVILKELIDESTK